MTQAVLYSFRRCPYAMRARMALQISELKYDHREVVLRDKPQAMLDASPKGTVPVFISEQQVVIDESLAVMKFALSQNDPQNWLRDESDFTRRCIEAMDNTFKFHLDRYKYASRYEENTTRGTVNLDHRDAAIKCLQLWEDALSTSAFLIDETPSLADVATFPFIRQFAATQPEWWDSKPLPKTANWLETLVGSELFGSIMKKHPVWINPTENTP